MIKNISGFLIFILLIFGCATDPITTKEDDQTFRFISRSMGLVSIMPTYQYIGEKDLSDQKATRVYHIWEDSMNEKYIMIYHLIAKQGTFPPGLQWVTPNGAIYIKGMRAAYTTIGEKPYSALQKFNLRLQECFILAQEVHHNDTEAVFRILIVPDETCAEEYEPVMEELDRVTIKDPLG